MTTPAPPRTRRQGGRTQQGTVVQGTIARSGGRTQQGTQRSQSVRPATAAQRRAARPAAEPAPRQGGRAQRSRGQRAARQVRQKISDTNYGGVIIAEFVGVILFIALAPIARTSSASSSGTTTTGYTSPYAGSDMVKLAAATLLFVILGMVAQAGRGAARTAAWFGGLLLIAVGLAEAASISGEISLFTGGLEKAASGAGNLIGPASGNVSGSAAQAGVTGGIVGATQVSGVAENSAPASGAGLGGTRAVP